jgi:hypothetical protein
MTRKGLKDMKKTITEADDVGKKTKGKVTLEMK